jgi:hypothetical protein
MATEMPLASACAAIHRLTSSGASLGSIHSASTCSPYMPRPRLATEMPIWVVAM